MKQALVCLEVGEGGQGALARRQPRCGGCSHVHGQACEGRQWRLRSPADRRGQRCGGGGFAEGAVGVLTVEQGGGQFAAQGGGAVGQFDDPFQSQRDDGGGLTAEPYLQRQGQFDADGHASEQGVHVAGVEVPFDLVDAEHGLPFKIRRAGVHPDRLGVGRSKP